MSDEHQPGGKILVVDDDPNVVKLVQLYLERDGYEVLTANDGVAGLELAREEQPDLIVLDLMLPRMDGMEVCRTLREESQVPIVMLTAMVEEDDRLAGLDLGADDYVTKPFSPRELAARVRAVLRRTARDQDSSGPGPLESGPFVVDLKQRMVSVAGTPITLTPTEFRLITLLVREPGRTFTREQIIDRVFGYDFDGFDRTVDAHMSSLRRKVDVVPGTAKRIQTVYGSGYRLNDG
ncbi:MAG: DNA-binding response regulator [SAR202 cluster bacterium Io17-Chloro-G6]|nr:MAG: DNA-binding response regulator [SAR202 cluster bacterium Io17-Chloro-G6]